MSGRLPVAACAALLLLGRWCAAQSEEPAAAPRSEQVLVMHNGQVLKGWISRSPNGYVVEHSAGRLVVPFDDAWIVGKDLRDAYRQMAESFPKPTAATHYQLALWGWSHQLKQEARTQLVLAIDRDAEHEAARDMLKRVDEQLAAERRRAAGRKTPAQVRMVGGIELPEIESLAGLSRETAAQFTTRIQPLLINKCGNATCHGASSNAEFRLEAIRGTGAGARLRTERNLAAMLNHLDTAEPLQSEILTVPAGNHAGLSRAIFFGPTGERQLLTLKNWIRSAAKEISHDSQLAEQRPTLVDAQPNFPKVDASEEEPGDESDSDDPVRMASARRIVPEKKPVEEDDAEDAFDPEVFNRRYHGTPGNSPKSRKSMP
jgi:hypothetical protein